MSLTAQHLQVPNRQFTQDPNVCIGVRGGMIAYVADITPSKVTTGKMEHYLQLYSGLVNDDRSILELPH